MSQTKETSICPVTFIDNNIVTDKDINGLFMNPYNCKIHADQHYGAMVNDIQRKQEDPNSRLFKNWRYNVDQFNERANSSVVKTYMITNISDLVRNTLIKFINE